MSEENNHDKDVILMASKLMPVLNRAGISYPKLMVLARVTSHPDGLPIGKISDLVGTSSAAVTGMIDAMEEASLVVRSRGVDDDRRKVHVLATSKGALLVSEMVEVMTDALCEFMEAVQK